MATHNISILGVNLSMGTSGGVYIAPLSSQLSLTNSKDTLVIVMTDPGGGGDHGIEGKFRVPENYVGSEVLVISYILDGAVGGNAVGFGYQVLALINDESADAAYGTLRTAAETPGEADEDLVEETIDISADTYVAGDEAFFSFVIDDSAHAYTGNVLLTGLAFEYSDA